MCFVLNHTLGKHRTNRDSATLNSLLRVMKPWIIIPALRHSPGGRVKRQQKFTLAESGDIVLLFSWLMAYTKRWNSRQRGATQGGDPTGSFMADVTGSIADHERRKLSELSIVAQLESSFREISDTWGISNEAMTGIAPESWPDSALGTNGDQARRPPKADMLAVHGAATTDLRKPQRTLSKLANQGRHAAHAAFLNQLLEMARPPGPDDSLQWSASGRSHCMFL